MDDRARRIIDTAIELAERDGYAAVRLREVAARAEVALGTVYKRFASKEEILVAAMAQEAERLLARFTEVPAGDTAQERVVNFYQGATDAFLRRPKLARAILRAIGAGEGAMTARIASIHALTTALLMGAITGEKAQTRRWDSERDKEARELASIFMQVWFAALVGWASGLHDAQGVVDQVAKVARRVL
tara:strand:- start:265 stop:831 length:567 start_codon:yes stop_codon:yes gene_type:complete